MYTIEDKSAVVVIASYCSVPRDPVRFRNPVFGICKFYIGRSGKFGLDRGRGIGRSRGSEGHEEGAQLTG